MRNGFIRQIKGWHYKAQEEDYFSKFVFEYLAFIAYLKRIRFVEENYDRMAIQRLKQDTQLREKYLQKLRSDGQITSSWEQIIDELDQYSLANSSQGDELEITRWWNCSHQKTNDKTDEESAKQSGVIHNLDDWENMVEFWYSIRNNLFHGAKDADNTRDKRVIEHGYKTLRPLVETLLNEHR